MQRAHSVFRHLHFLTVPVVVAAVLHGMDLWMWCVGPWALWALDWLVSLLRVRSTSEVQVSAAAPALRLTCCADVPSSRGCHSTAVSTARVRVSARTVRLLPSVLPDPVQVHFDAVSRGFLL